MSKIKVFDEHILTGSESVESILNRIAKNKKKKSKDQVDDSMESQRDNKTNNH